MDANQLRLAQLEDLLRRIDEFVDLEDFPELDIFVKKLLKESPEESLKIYNHYINAITLGKKNKVDLLYSNIYQLDN